MGTGEKLNPPFHSGEQAAALLPHAAAAGTTLPTSAELRVWAVHPLLLLWEEVVEEVGYPGGQSSLHLEVGQHLPESRRVVCGRCGWLSWVVVEWTGMEATGRQSNPQVLTLAPPLQPFD